MSQGLPIDEDAADDSAPTTQAKPPGTKRSRWPWVVATAALVAGLIAGAFTTLAFHSADLSNWSSWARDFTKSSGFAGVAAVVAALIAAVSIGRQVKVSRDALVQSRSTADASSWWTSFEWASGRAIPIGKDDRPLPDSVTIGTLQGLAGAAQTTVQSVACAQMINVLTARMKAAGIAPEKAEDVAGPGSSAAFDALESYVRASAGTPAASPQAEALLYERGVLQSLQDVFPSSIVPAGADIATAPSDAVIPHNGVDVHIEILYGRAPAIARAKVRSFRSKSNAPLVLVSRYPSPLDVDFALHMAVVTVQWRGPEDTEELKAAVITASAMRPQENS
ncbi:hypothetical protein AB0O16_07430 [Microbacterium sp. NPDC089180]|uniref:hypothetical protein n=1 Tax=unclassified Microbacterium TaxID=2609290 RepID=UPI003441A5E4